MNRGRTVEIVVQADEGGRCLVWDALGRVTVSNDAEELGRWLVEIARDVKVPEVEAQSPGGGVMMKTGLEWLRKATPELDVADERTAVHVVVQVCPADAPRFAAVVWPPQGRPVTAGTDLELGQRVDGFARDPGQPRVAAKAPGGDVADEAISRGALLLEQWFKGA